MTDDRPLSSEEMIRKARADLSRQPAAPETESGLAEAADELTEFETAPRADAKASTRPTTPRRRPLRTRAVPRDPFTSGRRSRGSNERAAAVAVAIGSVVFLIIGIAIALVVAAGSP